MEEAVLFQKTIPGFLEIERECAVWDQPHIPRGTNQAKGRVGSNDLIFT
jgi:hypothetical protein